MNTIINLIFIQIIVVCIVDISGFIDSLKYGLSKLLTKGKVKTTNFNLMPLQCSLCMTFWSCLIYLIYVGQFTIPYICFILLLACFSSITKEIIILMKDIIIFIINKIYNLLQ